MVWLSLKNSLKNIKFKFKYNNFVFGLKSFEIGLARIDEQSEFHHPQVVPFLNQYWFNSFKILSYRQSREQINFFLQLNYLSNQTYFFLSRYKIYNI
jgi:hypothetical protein